MADSFGNLKLEMETACEFLRSFTRARQGFTRRDGVAAVERVRALCLRMQQVASGGHGKEAAQAVASARKQILAAQARLDLLKG